MFLSMRKFLAKVEIIMYKTIIKSVRIKCVFDENYHNNLNNPCFVTTELLSFKLLTKS